MSDGELRREEEQTMQRYCLEVKTHIQPTETRV